MPYTEATKSLVGTTGEQQREQRKQFSSKKWELNAKPKVFVLNLEVRSQSIAKEDVTFPGLGGPKEEEGEEEEGEEVE